MELEHNSKNNCRWRSDLRKILEKQKKDLFFSLHTFFFGVNLFLSLFQCENPAYSKPAVCSMELGHS